MREGMRPFAGEEFVTVPELKIPSHSQSSREVYESDPLEDFLNYTASTDAGDKNESS
jgi:hypothetical protein